jgi:amidophosphoribosyltransferase
LCRDPLTPNLYRLNVFANALNELGKARANVDDVFTALRDVYLRCHGAFACTAMLTGFGILGFRQVAYIYVLGFN